MSAIGRVRKQHKRVTVAEYWDEELEAMYHRFVKLQFQKAAIVKEAAEIKKAFAKAFGLGRHSHITVYRVGETRVRGYTRESYTAVRSSTIFKAK